MLTLLQHRHCSQMALVMTLSRHELHAYPHRNTRVHREWLSDGECWHFALSIVMTAWACCVQANDPNASEAPALQVPKEYETGLINAFKQAIPQYLSNALSMSGK